MDNYGIETVQWYLNQYGGAILPSHTRLRGLDNDTLLKEVLKLDDKKRRTLLSAARNIRDAYDGTAKKAGNTTSSIHSNKLTVRQMHESCGCLSKLLTATEDIPEDEYGKEVAAVVREMLAETKSVKGGCSSCRHGRIVSKYRVRLYSLLKEGEYC